MNRDMERLQKVATDVQLRVISQGRVPGGTRWVNLVDVNELFLRVAREHARQMRQLRRKLRKATLTDDV